MQRRNWVADVVKLGKGQNERNDLSVCHRGGSEVGLYLPGTMDCRRKNPARAGMQQRYFARLCRSSLALFFPFRVENLPTFPEWHPLY